MAATRGRRTPISLLAVLVAAVSGTTFWSLRDRAEPAIDAGLAAELTTRVLPLVEEKISMDWNSGTTGARRMACAVRPVGVDPASATTIAQVQVVYGWARCETQTAEPGGTRVPVAVRLTPVTRVEVPADSDWSDGRVDAMFPERLHDVLLGDEMPAGTLDELEAGVQARLLDLAEHPVR